MNMRTLIVDVAKIDAAIAGPQANLYVAIDGETRNLVAHTVTSSALQVAIIDLLKKAYPDGGHPEVIVTDSAPGFASSEFEDFLRRLGIRHEFLLPFAPEIKGAVERVIRQLKGVFNDA